MLGRGRACVVQATFVGQTISFHLSTATKTTSDALKASILHSKVMKIADVPPQLDSTHLQALPASEGTRCPAPPLPIPPTTRPATAPGDGSGTGRGGDSPATASERRNFRGAWRSNGIVFAEAPRLADGRSALLLRSVHHLWPPAGRQPQGLTPSTDFVLARNSEKCQCEGLAQSFFEITA